MTAPCTVNAENIQVGDSIVVLALSDSPQLVASIVCSIERKPRHEIVGGGEYITLRMDDGGIVPLSTGRQVKVTRAAE